MNSLWLVPDDGEPILVSREKAVVGRESGLDVVVNDLSVSRKHAVIERDAGGSWLVTDQRSANGTWVNGQRIIKAVLLGGQMVRFGAISFRVSLEKPQPRPQIPAPPVAPPVQGATKLVPVAGSERSAVPPRLPAAPPLQAPPRLPPPAGGMSADEAAELLGVDLGAPSHEIRKRYQTIYNDFQIRITNAPTAALKRMYQKNLQDLKTACEVLAPGLLDRSSP